MPNRLLLALSKRDGLRRFILSRDFTKDVAYRFVAGEDLDDGIEAVGRLAPLGITGVLDYLGENVTNDAQADGAADAYLATLDAIARSGVDSHISVKLTQLGLDLSVEGTVERMEKICSKAAEVGTVVAIDMESRHHTDSTIQAYRRLRSAHDDLVLCLQAYLKRTPKDVGALLPLAPSIRLCKGAYDEPREVALGRSATRAAYRSLLRRLLGPLPYLAVATHDDVLIRAAKRYARRLDVPPDAYEFQMLYGVRRELQSTLASEGYRVRVYIPFGGQWYPYLMRRLAERPANLRFFLESLIRG